MFCLPSPEFFNIKDCVIAGDECVLITPKDMGVEWNEENKYFRSSVWRKSDMCLVSPGFRKFTNYGEKPEFEPLPEFTNFQAIKKIDGSLLIVSKYKGELIVRTRGTVDASRLENGHEIKLLKQKYPKAFDNQYLESTVLDSGEFTLLFEWTTPSNRIVLQESAEPVLWLIGMILHVDYSYVSQNQLDAIAQELGVERPARYTIQIDEDVEQLRKRIETISDIEGIVIYDQTGQILKKIKTLRYLELHRVFTGISSVDHLFEWFVKYGCTHRENFEALMATNFDWELVTALKNLTDELYNKWNSIQQTMATYKQYIKMDWFSKMDRKDQANTILRSFNKDSGIIFSLLDGKEISPNKLWNFFRNKV